MNRYLSLIATFSCLLCGSVSADDYFITQIQGDYETIYAVPSSSITDLGEGIKRAELLAINLDRVEINGVFATSRSLAVIVIEVNCRSIPRQFKENSEHVQFTRSSDPIDKTMLNPYKDWSPLPIGSGLEIHANFICQWPEIKEKSGYPIKIAAESKWDFIDSVTDTVERVRKK